jgi:hypothetical protein
MKMLFTFKQALAALFAVFALAGGVAGEAQALTFGSGDLVLALYGNNTEYLRNLGQTNALIGSGSTNFSIGASDLAAVSGTNAVKWALVSFSYDVGTGDPTVLDFSSAKNTLSPAPTGWSATELANALVANAWNAAGVWSAQSATIPGLTQLIAASDFRSFTQTFGTSGTLAGAFPVSAEGTLGGLLHLLRGEYNGNMLSTLGHAILSADGLTLTLNAGAPAAVPLPAAVILFGTGLIGLAGVARRQRVL